MRRPALFIFGIVVLELAVSGLIALTASRVATGMRQAALTSFHANLSVNRVAARVAELAQPRSMTLLFVGDVMLARGVAFYTEREGGGDYQFPFAHASSTLRGADLTVGNLEHPVSDRGRNQGSKYSLRAKPQSIAGLADAGFDVVSLANNHIWDWGTDALTDTLAQLDAAGIRHVGAGMNEAEANQPYTVEINGNSLVFVAWTDLYPEGLEAKGHESGISRFREAEAVETVRALAATYDVVVVLFHWGGEYQTSANEKQRRIARVLADAGADLVVGHHPHVVQETEQYRGGRIAYSLGNFIFDQGFSEETLRGLALRVTVTGKTITRVEELPTRMNRYFQPVFETL